MELRCRTTVALSVCPANSEAMPSSDAYSCVRKDGISDSWRVVAAALRAHVCNAGPDVEGELDTPALQSCGCGPPERINRAIDRYTQQRYSGCCAHEVERNDSAFDVVCSYNRRVFGLVLRPGGSFGGRMVCLGKMDVVFARPRAEAPD